jgi:hypothetical protein
MDTYKVSQKDGLIEIWLRYFNCNTYLRAKKNLLDQANEGF